jgi:hypothetical protein
VGFNVEVDLASRKFEAFNATKHNSYEGFAALRLGKFGLNGFVNV